MRGELTGSIIVRPSTPDELFRVALTADEKLVGVRLKLPGTIDLDPVSGQVTARFEHLPQLPFASMHVRFKGGPRAILANPADCGTYAAHSILSPWSGTQPVASESLFRIDATGCPQTLPFDPAIQAGTVNPVARAFTPFVFRIERQNGRQELERLALTLPPGVSAKLAGIPRCPVAQAAIGACDERTRIGTVTVGAGAGAAPLYLRGRAYLTDSYGGGRFGLVIVVRAIAGPFDLGTVIVRAAIHVDPATTQLRVVADPLPRILKGVPLRLRDVHLAIDRPGFIVNPTNCQRMHVQVSVSAVQGASVDQAIPFQVGNCAALGFSPAFSVALTGRGQTTDGKQPGMRVRIQTRKGQANLRLTAFTLPPQIAFDASRGGPRMCTRAQLALRACPPQSRVGTARAVTPLLSRPARGSRVLHPRCERRRLPEARDAARRRLADRPAREHQGHERWPAHDLRHVAGRAAELVHAAVRTGVADAHAQPLQAPAELEPEDGRAERQARAATTAGEAPLRVAARLGRLLA